MRRVFVVLFVGAVVASCAGNAGPSGTTTDNPRRTSSTAASSTSTPEETTSSAAPVAVPITGGMVVIADDQEPPTLNPFAPGGDNAIVSIVGQAHLAGVYDIDGTTLDLVPELVTQLPTVGNGGVVLNDDGTMTVRFEIRDDAVWSDGVPITGADLAFTLEVMTTELAEPRDVAYEVVTTEAKGKTFSLTFAAPTLAFETLFPYVIPKHAVEGSDFLSDWNTEMWPAAGPFVFSEWVAGEYIRLVRNENYWKTDPAIGDQLPYLDAVEFRFIPETESLIYSFTQREVDVIQPPPNQDVIERLSVLEAAGAELQVESGPVWEHLNFQFGPDNRNPESLNRYAPFRQAVAYALDANTVASQVGWIPIYSIFGAGDDGPWAQYTKNVDQARGLIAEACAQADRDCESEPPVLIFSTTSNAEERPRIANHVKAALEQIGIEVELQLEDSQLFFGETLDDGTWDVGFWAWVNSPGAGGSLRMLSLFDPDAPPPNGENFYRWGTPDSSVGGDAVDRFREVLALARNSVDPSQVLTLTRAAEQILADEAVVLPIAARPVLGAVWADKLMGYDMNPTHAGHTWNIEFWRRIDLP